MNSDHLLAAKYAFTTDRDLEICFASPRRRAMRPSFSKRLSEMEVEAGMTRAPKIGFSETTSEERPHSDKTGGLNGSTQY